MCKCEKKMVQIMKLNTCRETLNLHENGTRHREKNQLRSFRARFIYMHVKIIFISNAEMYFFILHSMVKYAFDFKQKEREWH